MSSSTLDPENAYSRDRQIGKGHGTGALGPSDTSDSGSDIAAGNAGLDLGDAGLISDTDAEGTGERLGVGRENAPSGRDIGVDRIVRLNAHGVLVPVEEDDDLLIGDLDLEQLSLEPPDPDEI